MTDIIKPDIDDPNQYFQVIADSTIKIRPNLSTQQHNKAHETKMVFNLNGVLSHIRKIHISGYVQTAL